MMTGIHVDVSSSHVADQDVYEAEFVGASRQQTGQTADRELGGAGVDIDQPVKYWLRLSNIDHRGGQDACHHLADTIHD